MKHQDRSHSNKQHHLLILCVHLPINGFDSLKEGIFLKTFL